MIEGVLFAVYFLLGCGGCLIASSILRKREQDAARYAAVIGMHESSSLMKLCTVTSYKISRVRKDLQRMIDRGDFGDRAYIDMSNLCFMRTPDAIPDGVAEAIDYIINVVNKG